MTLFLLTLPIAAAALAVDDVSPDELELPDALDLEASVELDEPESEPRELTVAIQRRPQSPGGYKAPVLPFGVRTESRVGLRQGTSATLVLELGAEVARFDRVTLELGGSHAFGRILGLIGVQRTMAQWDLVGDLQVTADRWLTVGPSLGVAARGWRQQGRQLGWTGMPLAGMRATAGLMGARTWRLALTTRILVDLIPTRLVLDTASVQTLTPVELQFGLRWNFGDASPPEGR